MAEEKVTADVAGLQVSNNTFSSSPPGSLLVAEECVMPQKGVIEPRRGQDTGFLLPTTAQIPLSVTEYLDNFVMSYATSKLSTSYNLGLGSGTPTNFSGGPYNPVDCDGVSTAYGRMKFGFAGGSLYFCTTTGPKAIDSSLGTPRAAGLLQVPAVTAQMASPAVAGWLEYGSSVAYRAVMRRPLDDGTSLLSPPSGRFVVTNRILAQPGQMTRSGGATVTVTLSGGAIHGLGVGDSFELTPGEADFAAGTYTVASAPAANSFTYASAGANVSNTVAQDFDTGPRNVEMFASLNTDATTSMFMRLYRSPATTTTDPSDEMYLVAEYRIAALNITLGVVGGTDTTPDSVISDPLYTNPQTGEGSTQANFQPPIYRDTDNWSGMQWYANTTGQHSIQLQILGVGSPDGIQDGDTLTIALPELGGSPFVFTFKDAPATDTEIAIFSDGAPSSNIELTTLALILVVNSKLADLGATARVYGESSEDAPPGKFRIERTNFSSTAISIKASRPESWVPALSSSVYTDSVAERIPSGLCYSKLGQPEAVPVVNRTTCGAKNYPIARIFGLQQALIVCKEGDGIYAVLGNAPFNVQQISTANIIAPDCAAVFADAVWLYTDQGILRVSDAGGATVVSRPIETELNELRAALPSETHDYSFAVPYETERRILFFVPFEEQLGALAMPKMQAWCYNNATQAWTGPLYLENGFYCGITSPSLDSLALGGYDTTFSRGVLTLENKGNGYTDYADTSHAVTISAVDVGGNPLLLELASLTGVEVGDVLLQGSSDSVSKVAAIRDDISATCIELYEEAEWTTGAATSYRHYNVRLQFQPMGNPSSRKTLTRLAWLAKPESFASYAGKSLLMTDQIQADDEIETPFMGFGMGGFGSGPFGNPSPLVIDVNPVDPAWTNAAEFFPGFSLSEAWAKLKLQGFVATIDTASAPAGRGR